jgi:acetyl-CoA carboxylase biotin carboxyl carrier protein
MGVNRNMLVCLLFLDTERCQCYTLPQPGARFDAAPFFLRKDRRQPALDRKSAQDENLTPEFGFELDEIEELVRLVESRGLAKLEVAEDDRRVVIRGARPERAHPAGGAAPTSAAKAAVRHPGGHTAGRIVLESPMVGVFYRAGSPDASPLVDVGDHVDVGQPIGLIEAMKVFSEIPSDHAGVVVEIVAQNGALVRQGEPLMYLRME